MFDALPLPVFHPFVLTFFRFSVFLWFVWCRAVVCVFRVTVRSFCISFVVPFCLSSSSSWGLVCGGEAWFWRWRCGCVQSYTVVNYIIPNFLCYINPVVQCKCICCTHLAATPHPASQHSAPLHSVHGYAQVHISTYIRIYIYIYTNVLMYISIHVYIYICIYVYM